MVFIDIIVSFLVSTLAGLGVGGGGLLVIYLVLLRSIPQFTAQGINLFFFISASIPAFAVNLIKKRLDLYRLLIISVSGIAFAIIGSIAAKNIDRTLLSKLFGALMLISGVLGFFGGSIGELFNGKRPKKISENK